MKRLLALTWKEFLQLKRDRITLRMIVLVPIMQTLIFGYAINYDVKHLRTVVFDEAKSVESRDLVSKMTAPSTSGSSATCRPSRSSATRSTRARASVGLVIDRDFGKDLHRGAPAQAFLIVNASDTTTSTQAMSIASGIANGLSIRCSSQQAGLEVAGAPDRPPRAALVQPRPEDVELHHPRADRHHPDVHPHPVHGHGHRARARARHARAAPGHAGDPRGDHPRQDPAVHAHRLLAAHDDGPPDAVPVRDRDPGLGAGALPRGPPLHRRGPRPRDAHLDGREDADAGDADVDVLPAAVRLPLRLRVPDRRHALDLPVALAR